MVVSCAELSKCHAASSDSEPGGGGRNPRGRRVFPGPSIRIHPSFKHDGSFFSPDRRFDNPSATPSPLRRQPIRPPPPPLDPATKQGEGIPPPDGGRGRDEELDGGGAEDGLDGLGAAAVEEELLRRVHRRHRRVPELVHPCPGGGVPEGGGSDRTDAARNDRMRTAVAESESNDTGVQTITGPVDPSRPVRRPGTRDVCFARLHPQPPPPPHAETLSHGILIGAPGSVGGGGTGAALGQHCGDSGSGIGFRRGRRGWEQGRGGE